MKRRTMIKWLHWSSLFLILYFWAVEPEDVERLGAAALATHAGVGTVFATVVLVWFASFALKGLAGRPGPKLPGWGKRFHPWLHKSLYWIVLAMVLSGGLIAVFAPYTVLAFGRFPFAPSIDLKVLHELVQEVHELLFNLALIGIGLHASFHIWRHYMLRDNALRIMAPAQLHKYL
jgi:cytochrome b561